MTMEPGSMYEIVYTSVARSPFDPISLAALLAHARQRNEARGITGLLLYHGGWFLQVLEGPLEALTVLLATLRKDDRHHHFHVLREGPIEARRFEEWTMGFVDLDATRLRALKGRHAFLSNGSLQGEPAELLALLDEFRNGQHRSLYA
jgi:hypothetical protein